MLCLKAEALGRGMHASHGVILPVNLGSSIQRLTHRGGGRTGGGSRAFQYPSSAASCSAPEDYKSNDSGREAKRGGKMCCYRAQLEQEVQKLENQLQEEIDLHAALANAVAHNAAPLLNSPAKLPDQVQELLANIAALEVTVSKLEEELLALHIHLYCERIERRLAETHLGCLPSPSLEQPCSVSGYTWDESHGNQISQCSQQDLFAGFGDQQFTPLNSMSEKYPGQEITASCSGSEEMKGKYGSLQQSDATKKTVKKTHLQNLSQLSEEMVRCMRNIFLSLSESSSIDSCLSSSECLPSPSSPVVHLSHSSPTSFLGSSLIPSLLQSPSSELQHNDEVMDQEYTFDPDIVNGKVHWRNIGSYSSTIEVSWISVEKRQLEYTAEALKQFRFLVEQLAKVNPAHMSHNERLAFWINLYNALIMHVSYTVGGQSFSAADIEIVILKMKPPAYHPQALFLALNNFKISEEHSKYSIDNPEPLTAFALSCGMYSSPAVRIFTADNVHNELQDSMRDYIQASICLSDKGKLLVPKLLYHFTKGVVEDSLLVDWICCYLNPDQVTIVQDSTWKQRLLGIQSFSLIPFDSRFRYLFMPDNRSSFSSSKGGFV